MNYNVKDMVKDNKQVTFKFFRGVNLYCATECGFVFPVPVNDVGDATFLPQDKAILFMRYINKEIKEIKEINKNKMEQEVL